MPEHGSTKKIPEACINKPTYAVGLTAEELRSAIHCLDKVLGSPEWRKIIGCGHVNDALSARVEMRRRLEGRG